MDGGKVPSRADYVEKRIIDRSTLYSFNSPFQLLHADVGNLESLGKNATFPQYVLVIVDLYSSKVYTYSVTSPKQMLQKIKLFYDEVRNKRKGKRMRLQVDNEFQQVKIKDLKNGNNVEMFTSLVKGSKAFAAEEKIRELKSRISKLHGQKLKISPTRIIENTVFNMNLMKSLKHGMSPEKIERRSLAGERFRVVFNMHLIKKTKKLHDRLNRYDLN